MTYVPIRHVNRCRITFVVFVFVYVCFLWWKLRARNGSCVERMHRISKSAIDQEGKVKIEVFPYVPVRHKVPVSDS